jgi:ribonuclease VapC
LTKGIVLDSSALVAILFGEPEHTRFLDLIFDAEERRVSSFSVLEAGAVILSRKGSAGRLIFDSLCDELLLQVVPFTAEHVRLARHAWEHFGRAGTRQG